MSKLIRHDWTLEEITNLYSLPFMDCLYKAHSIHRQYFVPNVIQLSTLLSIKTGTCPENCAYCPQSAHYQTAIQKHKLLDPTAVQKAAITAKKQGASRFCMGAAWRNPPKKEFNQVLDLVKRVKALGLETCMTLGMLSLEQAQALAESGLDYYNHNLDTSPEYYPKIITTRTYSDRLKTLENVRIAGIKMCCGGIIGMGETIIDRISFLQQLANLNPHPESVPINRLVAISGTPLEKIESVNTFEFVRIIALARILMPKSVVRLATGRETMNDELQALCFFAGANSIFYGEKLLTLPNPTLNRDKLLLNRLNIHTCHS